MICKATENKFVQRNEWRDHGKFVRVQQNTTYAPATLDTLIVSVGKPMRCLDIQGIPENLSPDQELQIHQPRF